MAKLETHEIHLVRSSHLASQPNSLAISLPLLHRTVIAAYKVQTGTRKILSIEEWCGTGKGYQRRCGTSIPAGIQDLDKKAKAYPTAPELVNHFIPLKVVPGETVLPIPNLICKLFTGSNLVVKNALEKDSPTKVQV